MMLPEYDRDASYSNACLSPDEYSYDFDFLVCALDLLAGLAEGVGPAFIQLTQNTKHCAAFAASLRKPH